MAQQCSDQVHLMRVLPYDPRMNESRTMCKSHELHPTSHKPCIYELQTMYMSHELCLCVPIASAADARAVV